MTKKELKEIMRPLVKDIVKEMMFENGFLSSIIKECVRGVSNQPTQKIIEQHQEPQYVQHPKQTFTGENPAKKRIEEAKMRMLKAIGETGYNGVNVFEGTNPLAKNQAVPNPEAGKTAAAGNPMHGIDPSDAGIDLSIFGIQQKKG